MSFAAAQKHVAVLQRAGLIQKCASGREQLVSTNRARLQRASELLDSFEAIWRQRVAQLTLTVVADFPVPQKRLWGA